MFRRLSILVRRPSDDRGAFARGWEHHGTIVKHLPGIRSYQQNHVVEEFGHVGDPPPFRVDGIVELRFDSPEAMKEAFASVAATPVKADEPNFLGHGTGYAMAVAQQVRNGRGRQQIDRCPAASRQCRRCNCNRNAGAWPSRLRAHHSRRCRERHFEAGNGRGPSTGRRLLACLFRRC